MNKRIVIVLSIISMLFFSLMAYLTYFELFLKEDIVTNPYNKRQWAYEDDIKRGDILDRDGVVLATTNEENKREYPYKNLYSHVIGYNSRVYGKSGAELKYNNLLLGKGELNELLNIKGGQVGHNLYLTIDHKLQQLASDRLGNNKGAVIAMNPKNGEILAMVSKPNFNPNTLDEDWNELVEDENAPFVCRATSGMYPPGSIFKIVTTAAALESGLGTGTFDDKGVIKIGNKEFENQKKKANGKITLTEAFAKSSNVVYCDLSRDIGFIKLKETAEKFGFNSKIDFDLPTNKSIFPGNDKGEPYVASLAIGQGDVLATPLQMALVTCAVANSGVVMKPTIAKEAKNKDNLTIWSKNPGIAFNAISPIVAEKIKEMMVEVVENGTGTSAKINGITVAGKTGTSENEATLTNKDKFHTWFTAIAPAEDPEIVVIVMMEQSGGSGGGNCAPIARDIIKLALQ